MAGLHINIDALRDRTKAAIRAGEITAEIIARRQQEAENRKRAIEELKAEEIFSQVGPRCEQEAAAGRRHAIIMSINAYEDYEQPYGSAANVCEPGWLQGVARRVYEGLQEANLNPNIEFWHDGVGIKSGFNIIVHW